MCFPNFGAARTPYLKYDIYTYDSLHGVCFSTVFLMLLVTCSINFQISEFFPFETFRIKKMRRLLESLLTECRHCYRSNGCLLVLRASALWAYLHICFCSPLSSNMVNKFLFVPSNY